MTKIECDYCNRDLTYTSNSIDYILSLYSKRMMCYDGPVTDMMICPEIEMEHNFCGMSCLKRWVNSETRQIQYNPKKIMRVYD